MIHYTVNYCMIMQLLSFIQRQTSCGKKWFNLSQWEKKKKLNFKVQFNKKFQPQFYTAKTACLPNAHCLDQNATSSFLISYVPLCCSIR